MSEQDSPTQPSDDGSPSNDSLRSGSIESTDQFGDAVTKDEAPWQADQEWANAMTHGFAVIASVILAAVLLIQAGDLDGGNQLARRSGMMIACAAYMAAVIGTFTFSTLSHVVRPSELLNKLRAWDQAMIYTMISGTYTPIIYRFADDSTRTWLLTAIWIAAAVGFLGKVAFRHRINSISTISYLALGWLPAIPLAGHVPRTVVAWMMVGGVLYTIGVVCLMNDSKVRYLHAVWHLFVMSAALAHYWTIYHDVVPVN
jgi:hemolysin III